MDCPESSVGICDRKLIYRVIYNFASNAVKFFRERQEARILIRRYQGSVRVEVIDYGIGIERISCRIYGTGFIRQNRMTGRNQAWVWD